MVKPFKFKGLQPHLLFSYFLILPRSTCICTFTNIYEKVYKYELLQILIKVFV